MPELLLDIFNDDAFSVTELGASINVVPNMYGRIGELNVFPDEGIPTTDVAIEENVGVLNMLQTARRGAPGTAGTRAKRKLRKLSTVHIPHDTQLTADDLKNLRGTDGRISLESAQNAINKELRSHRQKQDITREHLRAGALRGVILDADGSTILDLFSEYGVAQTEVDFVLGTAGTEVRNLCLGIKRSIQKALKGDVMTGVRALCSSTFFDDFIAHETVKRAWDNHQGNSDKLGDDPRAGFSFGGITFEDYVGEATFLEKDGTTTVREFIPDGDARFFPVGTMETFKTFNAPSDFMEDVGKAGEPYYVKIAPDPKMNRYVDVHSQQNPLPLCMRPAVLVRGYSSN